MSVKPGQAQGQRPAGGVDEPPDPVDQAAHGLDGGDGLATTSHDRLHLAKQR